jgi:hypothetical protein
MRASELTQNTPLVWRHDRSFVHSRDRALIRGLVRNPPPLGESSRRNPRIRVVLAPKVTPRSGELFV